MIVNSFPETVVSNVVRFMVHMFVTIALFILFCFIVVSIFRIVKGYRKDKKEDEAIPKEWTATMKKNNRMDLLKQMDETTSILANKTYGKRLITAFRNLTALTVRIHSEFSEKEISEKDVLRQSFGMHIPRLCNAIRDVCEMPLEDRDYTPIQAVMDRLTSEFELALKDKREYSQTVIARDMESTMSLLNKNGKVSPINKE